MSGARSHSKHPLGCLEVTRSDDELYQYELVLKWQPLSPMCGWILLNPSLGDRTELGDTARRCAEMAKRWGYGGIVIRNRFAYRAVDPKALSSVHSPHGKDNEWFLERAIEDPITIAAWGSHPVARSARPLPDNLRLWCVGINRDGSPRHPLHLPHGLTPRRWDG